MTQQLLLDDYWQRLEAFTAELKKYYQDAIEILRIENVRLKSQLLEKSNGASHYRKRAKKNENPRPGAGQIYWRYITEWTQRNEKLPPFQHRFCVISEVMTYNGKALLITKHHGRTSKTAKIKGKCLFQKSPEGDLLESAILKLKEMRQRGEDLSRLLTEQEIKELLS